MISKRHSTKFSENMAQKCVHQQIHLLKIRKRPEPKVKKFNPTPAKPKELIVENQPVEGQIAEEEKK